MLILTLRFICAMEDKEFSRRLGEAIDLFDASDFERSLRLARSLKKELLAAKVDPDQMGWSLYYEFKSLYELGEYGEAYRLLKSADGHHCEIPVSIAGWMHSVAAELAYLLKLPEDMATLGKRCIELYTKADELENATLCAQNCCAFLDELGRPDLKPCFENFLKERG